MMQITNLMFSSSSGANPVLQQVGGVVRGSRWLWHCGMGRFHHSHPRFHPHHKSCQNIHGHRYLDHNLSAKVNVNTDQETHKGAVELRDSCEQPGKAQLVRKHIMHSNQKK